MMLNADCCDFAAEIRETPNLGLRAAYIAVQAAPTPLQLTVAERNEEIALGFWPALLDAEKEGVQVTARTVENFQRLLALLPASLPYTAPYVSEAGSLCLDWDGNPQNQLSIMIQRNGRIAFAAYFAGERVNGSANFLPDGLPQGLVDSAARWAKTDRTPKAGRYAVFVG